jgi:hypothetical protein
MRFLPFDDNADGFVKAIVEAARRLPTHTAETMFRCHDEHGLFSTSASLKSNVSLQ